METNTMRPGGGKAKGAEFERSVCKRLSLWISHGKRDDLFWRSSMSGGRATIGKAKGIDRSAQVGDISAISDGGVFTKEAARFLSCLIVECKSVKNYQLDLFLFENRGVIADAIEQCRQATEEKTPFVVLKQNRGRELVVFTNDATINNGGVIDIDDLERYALIECQYERPDSDYYVDYYVVAFTEFLSTAKLRG